MARLRLAGVRYHPIRRSGIRLAHINGMRITAGIRFFISTILLLVTFASSNATGLRATVVDEPADAIRVWEQAIAAKGGRDRLHSIENMVVSAHAEKHVDFYAFPNKVWRWMDDRPSAIGLAVQMHNLEKGLAYLSYPNDPESPRKLGKSGAGSVPLRDAQLYFLLESKWIKPKLSGVGRARLRSRKADVIQTQVDDTRVDFYFDSVTHLPLRITFPYVDARGNYYVDFSDYAPVKGIPLPQKISYVGSGWVRTKYQLNVTYNESIFEQPPRIELGATAWRK